MGEHGETRQFYFFFGLLVWWASCLLALSFFFVGLLFVALLNWGLHPGVARGREQGQGVGISQPAGLGADVAGQFRPGLWQNAVSLVHHVGKMP